MRKQTDTLLRHWNLLELVPPASRAASTAELHQKLRDRGHDVNLRTVQRDLDTLSAQFPLVSVQAGQRYKWHWLEGARGLEIPGMSSSTALTFVLAEQYLSPLLPKSVIETLEPYFERARRVLSATKLNRWQDSVRLIPSGQQLHPPSIAPGVRQRVMQALIEGCRLSGRYARRHNPTTRTYEFNPLGLVLKQGMFYLVCTLWDYEKVVQFALHRMRSIQLLDKPATPLEGFSLEKYIGDDAGFAYPVDDEDIELVMILNAETAFHVDECKLDINQLLEQEDEDRFRLTARVKNTLALRWWILRFGDRAEVIAPQHLRDEIGERARKMAERYLPP